jgi:ABC-type polysaccharide/polyol phosphate export permease
MFQHFIKVWQYRELTSILVVRNMKIKYKGSILGFLWTLISPLMMLTLLLLVFTNIVRIPIPNYWAFLLSGFFLWTFSNQSITSGTLALTEHTNMVRNAVFPPEIPIIASILAKSVEFLIELTLVIILIAVVHHKGLPGSYILIPVLLVPLMLLTLGLTLPLASAAVFYYDVRHMLPILMTAMFYISPIFYSVDLVPPVFQPIYTLNPFAHLLTCFQKVLYHGGYPSIGELSIVFLVSIFTFLVGYAIFNRHKHLFAEIL